MNSMKQTYTEANPGVESLVKDHMELVRKIAWHMHGRVRNDVEIDDLLENNELESNYQLNVIDANLDGADEHLVGVKHIEP